MKKLTALFLSTLMVLTLVISMATFAVSADTVTADKSWYNENQTEFTITTPAQLLGFAELVSAGTTFEGKTVKLGNDITMNAGFDGNKPADATNLVEYSITSDSVFFHGTFDGQNHAIIGLYMDQVSTRQSMFASVDAGKTATVKNLAIIKSYMAVIGNQTGCLFGRVNGTVNISNCYVDVNMDFALEPGIDRNAFGGFVGVLENANSVASISNCVFAGVLKFPTTRGIYGGFIGRAENYKTITITNSAMYGNIPTGGNNSVSGFIGRVINRTASITFDGCICAGGGTGITGAFWTPHQITTDNKLVDVQIKKSFYTNTYPDSSNLTTGPIGATLIYGGDIIGKYAAEFITEKGLTGWSAVSGYYPLPQAMSNMVAALQLPTLVVEKQSDTDGDNTAFAGCQSTAFVDDKGNIRLIGVVDDTNDNGSLDDEYTAVGFEVEMTSPIAWNNQVEGAAPQITTVYTSVQDGEGSKSAKDLGGDYIFVATITGVKQSVGEVTFVVKTFHDDLNGVRVYGDTFVIAYNTGAVAS